MAWEARAWPPWAAGPCGGGLGAAESREERRWAAHRLSPPPAVLRRAPAAADAGAAAAGGPQHGHGHPVRALQGGRVLGRRTDRPAGTPGGRGEWPPSERASPSRPVPSQWGCLPRALGKATPTCADFFPDLLGRFVFFKTPQKNLGRVQYVIRFLSQPGKRKSISGKVLWTECFQFYSYKCRRELGKLLHGSQSFPSCGSSGCPLQTWRRRPLAGGL